MSVEVYRFEMSAPDDMHSFKQVLQSAAAQDARRLAIVAKTEGTATINDFGRSLASRAIHDALAELGICAHTQIILSMGSEGVISPGGYLFADRAQGEGRFPGLALGTARSQPLPAADLVNDRHIEAMRRTVLQAIDDAGIPGENIALVLAKTPLLTREIAAGLSSEQKGAANSSAMARAAAALGIGIALGEVDPAEATAEAIGKNDELFSRRAMVFSGTETRCCEVIVLGNKPGHLPAMRSGIIADLIDIEGMSRIVTGSADGGIEDARTIAKTGRISAAFLKAGVASNGRLRGNRTTIFSSDLDPDKHMRAAASGALGALLGDTRFFVSGGAEHQAPPGGGIFAVILNRGIDDKDH
jgi:cyanuric acid amidohydrolase